MADEPVDRDTIAAKPKKTLSPEHMAAMRAGYAAAKNKGGQPRKVTVREARENALAELEPKAIQVLRSQLDHEDPKIQQSAAIKVIEYARGKPTQQIKQETTITAIEYQSAAWRPMRLALDPTQDVEQIEGEAEEE